MKKFLSLLTVLFTSLVLSAQEVTTLTCVQAAEQAFALGENETGTTLVAVTGYITNTNGTVSREQQTFWMDDEKGTTQTLQAYWANLPEDDKETPLAVGDKVVLTGYLLHYVNSAGTIHVAEIKNGNVTVLDRTIVKMDTIEVSTCEAIEEGEILNAGEFSYDIFEVSGVVASVINTNTTYHRQTFEMICKESGKTFEAYNCNILDECYVAAGDSVLVRGKLQNYNGKIEIPSGKVEIITYSNTLPDNVTIPSDAVLNTYKADGANVVVAFYTTAPVCNDIVFTGSYNGWSSNPYACTARFESVVGFDGWFVTSFADASTTIEGIPVQLMSDGSFSWDYLMGDDVELIRGSLRIEPGYIDEVTLKGFGTKQPVVFWFSKWKRGNSPCITPPETYTLNLFSDAYGSVAGMGTYNKDEIVTFSANPYTGYYFTQWSDGNTDNPRTITIVKDTTFTAVFAHKVKVSTENNSVSIQNASAIWPIYMDDITYASNQELVAADFRSSNDYYSEYPANHMYIWVDTYYSGLAVGLNSTGTSESYLSLIVGSAGWSGMGFNIADPQSRIAYSQLCHDIEINPDEYYIHFAMKSTDNATHLVYAFNEVGNAQWSIGGDFYDNGMRYPSSGNFDRDGTWTEFDFPLAPFASRIGAAAHSQYDPNIFCVLSGGILGTQLDIDAIYIYRKSEHSISVINSDGVVLGCGYYIPGETVTLTAIPAEGKNFIQWQDGNTDNPRSFVATQDTVFTAEFSHTYRVTFSASVGGQVSTTGGYYPADTVISISATPDWGYKFDSWSDGNTDNPRLYQVSENAQVTAYFADYHCGNTLMWNLDDGILVISGHGEMFDYNTSTQKAPWSSKTADISSVVLPDGLTYVGAYAFDGLQNRSFKKIIIPQTVTSIGAYAFIECNRLTSIYLPYALEDIGDYAFAECTRINDITILAQETPDTYEHTFDGVSRLAYLYVPCENKRAYQLDANWKDFDIKCIGAEQSETTTDSVVVTPSYNDATITWPSDDNAATYTIEITKDGEVFCRLVFNSNGQLTGIAFAMSADGERPGRAASSVDGGWQFTVTGLNPGTKYGYEVTAKSADSTPLNTYTGTFETEGGSSVATDISTLEFTTPTKRLVDGQLLITREGKTYNAQGTRIE